MYPLTSVLAHWQGIKLIAGEEDEKWMDRHAEEGKGSVDEETMDRRRDELMRCTKGKKNEGCRSVAAGSSGFRRALCLCGLIASMSLFEVLAASVPGCQPIMVCVVYVCVCMCAGEGCVSLFSITISQTRILTLRASEKKDKALKMMSSVMSVPLIIRNCAHKHHTTQSITCKIKQSRMSPAGKKKTWHFTGNFMLNHKIALGRRHGYVTKCFFLDTCSVMLIIALQCENFLSLRRQSCS